MDETRARFLTAIAARLGEERIVELHLFSPIRQGVLETGVAVVAVTPDPAAASAPAVEGGAEGMLVDGEEQDLAVEASVEATDDAADKATDETIDATPEAPTETPTEAPEADAAAGASSDAEPAADLDDGAVAGDDTDAAEIEDDAADDDEDSPYADESEASAVADDADATASDASPAVEVPAVTAEAPAAVIERHVIYTARYRLTRKGPDRGKWLFELAATADAPLATADVVARGVTLRAKDVTETERFSGEQLRALLQEPAWRTAP